MHTDFIIIKYFCIINLAFPILDLSTFLFTRKTNRSFRFPTFVQIVDLGLLVSSLVLYEWITLNVDKTLHSGLNEHEYQLRFNANIRQIIDQPIEYMFTIILISLIMRVMANLEFHETIGPITQVLFKMVKDFFNFTIIMALVLIMFAIVGNINFVLYTDRFDTIMRSVRAIFDAAINNYNLDVFDEISDPTLRNIGLII